MMKALFFDVRNHLHAYIYREALLGRHIGRVNFFLPVCNEHQLSLANAYAYARSQGFEILYLCTLDGNINFELVCILLRSSFSRSTYVITNFFQYHKFNAFSLKALLLFALLLLSNRFKIIISDPLLETRAYFPFFRKKIFFAPDFCLDRERPDIYTAKASVLPFVIPHDSLVVSFIGSINNKKLAVEFVSAIFTLQHQLQKSGFFCVIAGRILEDIPSHIFTLISQLANKGLVGFIPEYIPENIFYGILSISNYSWCLQKNFSASSGIFTRSCAWGVLPLVAKGTVLDLISTRYDLGYSFDPSAITADLAHFFSTQAKNSVYKQKSKNCKSYSAQCGEANYRNTFHSVISQLE